MKRILLVAFIIVSFVGCGIPEAKYNSVVKSCDSLAVIIKNLEVEIDELKNGEERLVNLAQNSFDKGEYKVALVAINKLKDKHPDAAKLSYFEKMADELDVIIEKQRKDSIKLANIDNLGIWKIGYYVDKFNEPTKDPYISTEVNGRFSNSATTNSDLKVRFLVDFSEIRIQLYEYGRNHPIKGEEDIIFYIRDSEGKEHKIRAFNYKSGDTSVKDNHVKVLRNILLKGGNIKFHAKTLGEYSYSEYHFELKNADYFENAWEKMKLSKNKK